MFIIMIFIVLIATFIPVTSSSVAFLNSKCGLTDNLKIIEEGVPRAEPDQIIFKVPNDCKGIKYSWQKKDPQAGEEPLKDDTDMTGVMVCMRYALDHHTYKVKLEVTQKNPKKYACEAMSALQNFDPESEKFEVEASESDDDTEVIEAMVSRIYCNCDLDKPKEQVDYAVIAGGVVGGLLGLLLIVILFVYCWIKRRARRRGGDTTIMDESTMMDKTMTLKTNNNKTTRKSMFSRKTKKDEPETMIGTVMDKTNKTNKTNKKTEMATEKNQTNKKDAKSRMTTRNEDKKSRMTMKSNKSKANDKTSKTKGKSGKNKDSDYTEEIFVKQYR